jgi:hypothetical protein
MTDAQPHPEFRPGLYRHYKGGLYTVICLVTHHETRRPMVLYVSHAYGGTNVRPLVGWRPNESSTGVCVDRDGWLDWVDVDVGGLLPNRGVRRFQFVGDLPSDEKIVHR